MIAEKKGNQKKADEFSERAMKVADINQLNNFGYMQLQQGNVEKAISIFKINTERNPKDANCWDSLGEGYASAKQNAKAIECFKKSLALDPPDATRQNSQMWLKKLQ